MVLLSCMFWFCYVLNSSTDNFTTRGKQYSFHCMVLLSCISSVVLSCIFTWPQSTTVNIIWNGNLYNTSVFWMLLGKKRFSKFSKRALLQATDAFVISSSCRASRALVFLVWLLGNSIVNFILVHHFHFNHGWHFPICCLFPISLCRLCF